MMLEMKFRSVGGGPDGDLLDTADTVAVAIAANLKVAAVAPGGAPRVANKIIVLAVVVGAVAHSCDGVIELGAAVVRRNDARFVVTELGRIGIDGD